ncbi:MAG: RagB/SusD family nutrient uptake outer membrane protein [Proteiniphilum sp.]|jgi:hypothetical protein|nr:RagB/SusD family nutrient uptake outer membrane protein [Proteiniphilum sp.]
MKNIVSLIILIAAAGVVSCEDFLERYPKTEITANDYFKTSSDLELYSNRFYQQFLSAPTDDVGSDNVTVSTNANTMFTMVNNNSITSSNIGGWDRSDWAGLRLINYMLDNIYPEQMNIAETDLLHYIGIAKFFRGYYYYNKVKNYSSVPYYNTAMSAMDEDLYKASDPRTVVVDSVIKDLEYAAAHIHSAVGQRTRLNRYAALALLARVSLHEATFRKYHPELGLTGTANAFFEKAVAACEEIMGKEVFEIHDSYGALFHSSKLRENKEIILAVEYDQALGRGNNTHVVLGEYWGLSHSLMEAYQTSDGKEFSLTKDDGSYKSYAELFEDRDPRLMETFAYPGFKISPELPNNTPYRPRITRGGFDQLKFYPRETSQRHGYNMNYTSLPLFRYAEVLLIYAEAKAERGTLTQADLDKSVNRIRGRTGIEMPAINTSGNVLEKIRNERRVELACEGFRPDDLKRWKQGELLGRQPRGIYISELGAFDVTGDDIPDVALLLSPKDEDQEPIAHLEEDVKKALTKEFLYNENGNPTSIYLSKDGAKSDTEGYIEFLTCANRAWHDKFYYVPIPHNQKLLNPKLIQPPGWENEQ